MWVVTHLRKDQSTNCFEVIGSYGPIYDMDLAHQIQSKLSEESENHEDKFVLTPLNEVLDMFFNECK